MAWSTRSWIGLVAVLIGMSVWEPAATLAQPRDRMESRRDTLMMLAGPGATIGVGIRDIDAPEAERRKLPGSVLIEEVRSGSPAEKAGLKISDVITGFDGEPVRSARQLSRLVQETPPGRTVTLTVMREGRKIDAAVVPDRSRPADIMIDRDRLAEQMQRLQDRLRFRFDAPEARGRLGATIQELTPQLAEYFGAGGGVLISAVAPDTPAFRAGLKAGDVITTIDGRAIASRTDLVSALRDLEGGREVTIGIVRDKKENRVTATLDTSLPRRGRAARFTRVA